MFYLAFIAFQSFELNGVKMKLFLKLFIVTKLLREIYCASFLEDEVKKHDEDSIFIGAVANIVHVYYTTKSSYTNVINSVSERNQQQFKDIVTGVLKNFDTTVQIEDVKHILKKEERKRFSVLIFIDSTDSFMKYYSKFSLQNFKFQRYFTVILVIDFNVSEIQLIFDLFWKKFIKNVNLIIRHNNGTIDLFTFLPFNETNKCGNTTPLKINQFDKGQLKWKSDQFFPLRVRDMQKCPLIIGCAVGTGEPALMMRNDSNGNEEIYGIEKDIFMELAWQLNFEPKFEVHGTSPGIFFENGTSAGLI